MPLINQYFKNHCLYFLSTPAKVLGSGGHSSNKEKEMIARWSFFLFTCNTRRCYVLYSFHLSLYPFYQCFPFLFLAFSFPFLPFALHLSIFCKMSALVRHRVSLFGKIPVSFWIFSLFSVFLVCGCIILSSRLEQVQLHLFPIRIQYVMTEFSKRSHNSLTLLYMQARMLQQLLTVFTSWHAHWMQGLVFFF